jgi:hypothetical protein
MGLKTGQELKEKGVVEVCQNQICRGEGPAEDIGLLKICATV